MKALPGELKAFVAAVEKSCPESKYEIDPPATESGSWFIDFPSDNHTIVVEWRKDRGFSLASSGDDSYGDGPSEMYRNAEVASRRVIQLIVSEDPIVVGLKQLREIRGLSQVALAEKLKIQQSAVSKLEQRDEVKLGTLVNAVEAMGGKLDIRAHFDDFDLSLASDEKA